MPLLLDIAAQYGVEVAFHLEPYTGRTAASTVADITYVNARYGSHPDLFRDPRHGSRPVFYVFNSLLITDWSPLAQVNTANIVLTQTTDVSKATYFGGLYNYAVGTDVTGWKGIADRCCANGRIWAPSVGPGHIDDRAVPGNTTPTLPRDNGATYDRIWSGALSPANGGPPTWVSLTSFNEWHEGTMIEPATSTPPSGYGYQTFDGAYGTTGTTGTACETSYLARTLYWVQQFTGGATPPPTTPPPTGDLALHRAVTAGSSTQDYLPANAVDGDPNSYWESADSAFPQSIQVDLGAALTVARIVVGLPPAAAQAARIEVYAS